MDYKDYLQQNKNKKLFFWHKARNNLIFKLLKSVFKNNDKNNLILNVGCGTGTEMDILQHFGNITGIDNSPETIKIVKQKYDVILGDIEKIQLNRNYYDCICAFDVLEHLNEDKLVLEKIFQALKPNGYFIFTVPAFNFLFGPHDIALDHKRRYSKNEIILKLNNANFTIISIGYWNTFLFPIAFLLRITKKFISIFFKIKASSESKSINKHLNNFFYYILNFENKFIFSKKPFGLSIYGITKKEKNN